MVAPWMADAPPGCGVEPPYEVAWQPDPGPQSALISCPVFEVLYGGARGGGKTDGILGEWASHAAKYGEDAVGLMVRRERENLKETIARSKQIYGKLGARYKEVDKVWEFPNGARLRFGYLETDKDAEAWQGGSFTRFYPEELTHYPHESVYLKLMATLRSGKGVPCGVRATSNPGGPGHGWVKKRFIDPAPLGLRVIEDDYDGVMRDRIYIPSRVSDNRHLGPEYVANLKMQGSEALVRAWLAGDWTVVEGAYFSEFDPHKHVVEPFQIPADWYRYRAMDWGSAAPFCVLWIAVAQGDAYGLARGTLVVYREWYGADDKLQGLKLPAEEVGLGILKRQTPDEKKLIGVIDPSAKKRDGGPSIIERMMRVGVMMVPGDNNRIPGWDRIRSLLRADDEHPGLRIFSTCRHLIRTLPALQHDTHKPEDMDTEGEDHAVDTLRYGTMFRASPRVDAPEPSKPVYPSQLPIGKIIEWSDAQARARKRRLVRG